jgi:hypothetical protein
MRSPPHANVVRLYGYCLEPPTVCLILELLPRSLKDLLYVKTLDASKQRLPTDLHDSAVPYSAPAVTAHATASSTHSSSTASTAVSAATSTRYATAAQTAMSAAPIASDQQLSAAASQLQPLEHGGSSGALQQQCRAPPLTISDVLRISLDIAAGLEYLHDLPDVPPVPEEASLTTVNEATEQVSPHSPGTAPSTPTAPATRKTHKIVHRGEASEGWGT